MECALSYFGSTSWLSGGRRLNGLRTLGPVAAIGGPQRMVGVADGAYGAMINGVAQSGLARQLQARKANRGW